MPLLICIAESPVLVLGYLSLVRLQHDHSLDVDMTTVCAGSVLSVPCSVCASSAHAVWQVQDRNPDLDADDETARARHELAEHKRIGLEFLNSPSAVEQLYVLRVALTPEASCSHPGTDKRERCEAKVDTDRFSRT